MKGQGVAHSYSKGNKKANLRLDSIYRDYRFEASMISQSNTGLSHGRYSYDAYGSNSKSSRNRKSTTTASVSISKAQYVQAK